MAAHIPTQSDYPATLLERRQWLVWKYIRKAGQKKPSKMPYYATTGHLRGWPYGKPKDGHPTDAKPQVDQGHELDRDHLVDFVAASEFATQNGFDGVGFAFLPGDGLIGIDLDGVIGNDTDRNQLGQKIMEDCNTFSEISPSGTGLHIIGLGQCDTFKSNDVGIEVFCGRQFFTMPGAHHPDSPFELRPIHPAVLDGLRKMVDDAKDARRPKQPAAPVDPAYVPQAASNSEAGRYCLAALDSAVQRLRSAGEGGRNDLLNGEAYGLGQLLHTGGISEHTIKAALTDAALACGLPAGEIAATLRSGLESGKRNPRTIETRPQRHRATKSTPAPAPIADPETGEIIEPANDNEPAEQTSFGTPVDPFGVASPPELPLDILPEPIRDYVRDQAELLGSDPAVIGLCALVAAAACIHDGIKIYPKRKDLDWKEHPRLWVAIVGDPSTRKSPAIAKAVRAVRGLDIRMAEENASAMSEYKYQHDQWKEARKADKSLPEPSKPAMRRLVVEDTTIEALSEVLKDNPRGVLTLKDELTGWFASMDAYKGASKGASMDRAMWLEAYNGGRRIIDRVQRGNIIVPNWSTSIIGGIQPDMMRRVASSMGNDGLLQRFMVLVARPAGIDADRVPDLAAKDRFHALFQQLEALKPSGELVRLTEDAHLVRERITRRADAMIKAFDHPHIQAWLGKWTGLFGRLLLTYHVIECASDHVYPTERDVSESTALQVERLMCDVLLHHAIHFYNEIIDAHERQENIRQLARLILAKRFDRLTKRDLTLHWKQARKLEWWEVRSIVEALCSLGWLEPDPLSIDSNDGKPKAWAVNPAVHETFSKQADREKARRKAAMEVIREIKQDAAKAR